MSVKDWEKLNITRDEVNRIGEALKNQEFRKLFAEYCEEISNPENKKKYEEELTQLENERGIDISFIHPEPGYVIKTSADGKSKTFINVASNEKIEKPTSHIEIQNGNRGLSWSIPYSLAPPRPDQDKKGQVCHVYDIVFNPMTLHLASKNKAFRDLVNKTAVDAVQSSFNVTLDKINLKFPKLNYKGVPKAAVIRKKSENAPEDIEPSPIDSIYPPLAENSSEKQSTSVAMEAQEPPASDYTTPKHQIIERHRVDLVNEIDTKDGIERPKELLVIVELPLLSSSQELNLDVTNNMIHLVCEKPAKYKTQIKLPYNVDEKSGNAKFEKSKKQLLITLPIVADTTKQMHFVEHSNDGQEEDLDENTEMKQVENGVGEVVGENEFLEENVDYLLPAYSFNQVDEILAFTFHVKGCASESIKIKRCDEKNLVFVKFFTIGSGYYPINYSFCVQFDQKLKEVFCEAWDNNVIFQIELEDPNLTHYFAGKSSNLLEKHEIVDNIGKDKNVSLASQPVDNLNLEVEVKNNLGSEITIEIKSSENRSAHTSNDEVSEDVAENEEKKMKKLKKSARRRNNRKMRSLSESCCENLKDLEPSKSNTKIIKECPKKMCSLSESSCDENLSNSLCRNESESEVKGILKHRVYDRFMSECNESEYFMRNSNSLSLSESIDFGNCQSHDSMSMSESYKTQRHVHFNLNIKRQLYRSNTSILKQKKINQKKKESRRRNRRHSEGSEEANASSVENISSEKRDSGIEVEEKPEKNCSSLDKPEMHGFKSGFIFDLEI